MKFINVNQIKHFERVTAATVDICYLECCLSQSHAEQTFSWSHRYILPYTSEVFLRKSTIEKSILNKSLLFQTRQINNQLQDKVDQHLRQSVKQLTIENIFQKLMKLQRICTATPSWKRQKIFRFFHVFRDCSNAKLCRIDLTKINYCQCHTHLSKLYDI